MSKIGRASRISDIIKQKSFYIKKKYGQNFLVDQNILEKIVDAANITDETLVVEVGPGFGSLTEHLIERSKHVLAYEIDEDLVEFLTDTFETDNLTVVHEDVLNREIDDDIEQLDSTFDQVVLVANLPYYITTPVVMKVLEQTTRIERLIVMTQHEVALRMTSNPKTKDYNSLSIAIQYRAETEYLFKVPRTVFIPKPNVDSAIISLKMKQERALPKNLEPFFFRLIKTSFKQRRKTLYNNLKGFDDINNETIKEAIDALELSPTVRAEALDVHDFIELTHKLIKD
ncbi:MAG: 16S rRNA (adenine(1518)-N(6)/adenine(1519)-N(6))-dimethyltransferase RsmA [Candidatus Izemoplasma sp.]|nr:16S rRNA (adenine(1518)-N(6)/adenine(1519)-N(6))-dimethyltransferase RsmA [Candidatus Izemoplasma sp.]